MSRLTSWTDHACARSEDCDHCRQQAAPKSHPGLFRSSDLHSHTVRRSVMHRSRHADTSSTKASTRTRKPARSDCEELCVATGWAAELIERHED